jgi:hypothetical protein
MARAWVRGSRESRLDVFGPAVLGLAAIVLALGNGSCGSSQAAPDGGAPTAGTATLSLFVAPDSLDALAADHVYDHPWPSDLRRDPDGHVHFDGFYNPRGVPLLTQYLGAARGLLDGFSPVAAAYLRFDGPIDPATLPPSPMAATAAGASVSLVDVDPASPEHGTRKLIQTFWRKDAGVYWLPNTLAIIPALGYPLRPHTRYAIVATRALRNEAGTAVGASADLREVLGVSAATARTAAARAVFAPAVAELASAGVATTDIVHLTVFTTNDPTDELYRVIDDVPVHVPAPSVESGTWTATDQDPDYDVYEGRYSPAPNYQAGKVPYQTTADGGGFQFQGKTPVVQNTFDMRFALVVPNAARCPVPATGYPVVLYGHGTGGDYRSIVDEGGSIGRALARQCLASVGTDQIFHGDRPGAPPASDPNREATIQLLFFNLLNIAAARTNGRQSAVDVVQEARLFTGKGGLVVPASVARGGQAIAIDGTRLSFFGHSQGGLNGSLFLAGDASARGGVLSGSGSLLTVALLEKTEPAPSVADLVRAILSLSTDDEKAELNLFHPATNFAQTLIDPTDPIHYVGAIALHPRPGFAPKSVYQTEGINPDGTGDHFAPPHGIEIGAVATGLPRMLPGVRPVVEASYGGLADVMVPAGGLHGNLAGGKATGVLAQFPPAAGSDGHFVVFDVPAAHAQAAGFAASLAQGPVGVVPSP